MNGNPVKAEGKHKVTRRKCCPFLAKRHGQSWEQGDILEFSLGLNVGNQCCILNKIFTSIITSVMVELCSAAFSQAIHRSQLGLTQDKKVSLRLCTWSQERMLDQKNDVFLMSSFISLVFKTVTAL